MQIAGMCVLHTELVRSLKQMIEVMEDGEDKLVSKCMFIMIASLDVGPDINRLVEYTGYPRKFIKAVSQRMRNADLWGEEEDVDDLGWWFHGDNLTVC